MSTSDRDIGRNIEQDRLSAEREVEEREPHVIEERIDATRADMRATLEALERRFSFDRLMELTVGRIRERGGEFAGNLTDVAARNPMPLVLTSIGLAWMMLTSRRGTQRDDAQYYSRAGERRSRVGERLAGARERAAHAADQLHGAVDSTRDTLKHAADSSRAALRDAAQSSRETYEHTAESLRSAAAATRERVDDARARMDRLLNEQPLMLGALGLAAGAIIGALLPTTEHEDRFLGEARDKAVRTVAKKSRERAEAAREHAATYSAPGSSASESASRDRPASRPH